MALSVIEIDEEDCGTHYGFNIRVLNDRHAKSLIGKWFKTDPSKEWELFGQHHIKQYIGQYLIFRSPITCFTNNYKTCQKCFGHYPRIKTPYVGIIAGQVISEKTTQLSMRSFHTSGSSTLSINDKLKEYIRYHLVNINLSNNNFELMFDENIPTEIIDILIDIPGYVKHSGTICSFDYIYDVQNEDIGKVIKDLKNCLLTEKTKNITPIEATYEQLISSILSVGDIFSTFIEIVLCNLYTNNENKVVRYQLKDGEEVKITKKYSVYHVHSILSPTLNLLYKPNLKTISKYYNDTVVKDNYKPSIFEKIWLDI